MPMILLVLSPMLYGLYEQWGSKGLHSFSGHKVLVVSQDKASGTTIQIHLF